jgi:hypothetical protein
MHRKIVKRLLRLQDTVKVYHWTTKRYNNHIASDELYKDLSLQIDAFVEAFIGRFGRPSSGIFGHSMGVKISALSDSQFEKYLSHMTQELESGVLGLVANMDNGLSSIRDEMIASINKCKFLMTL